MSSNIDDARLSSPDPLNDSLTFTSPVKPRPRNRKSFAIEGSSPRKQTFELNVGDKVSPQKIRVTVETEASDKENTVSKPYAKLKGTRQQKGAMMRRNEHTTTTTIPVKGLSDSESDTAELPNETSRRGRGRPRKSGGTSVPLNRRTRTLTPSARPGSMRRRTLVDLADDDDEDDWDFKIGAGVEVGRGKGRSRSRSVKESSSMNTPAPEPVEPQKNVTSTTQNTGKGRRKASAPEQVIILDESQQLSLKNGSPNDSHTSGRRVLAITNGNSKTPLHAPSISPSENFPHGGDEDSTAVSFSIIHMERKFHKLRSSYMADQEHHALQSITEPSQAATAHDYNHHHTSALRDPTPLADEEDDYDGRVEHENEEPPEFDTVLESEGFSMISVDDVPSLREHLSSPAIDDRLALVPTPTGLHAAPWSPSIVTDRAASSSNRGGALQSLSNPRLSSIRAASIHQADDSFSSIPPEILEAATPRRSLPNNRLLSLRTRNEGKFDDSFSSIPSAILDAATPARHRKMGVRAGNVFASQERSDVFDSVMLLGPSESFAKNSAEERPSSRMITPEESPPRVAAAAATSDFERSRIQPVNHADNHNMHYDRPAEEASNKDSSTLMRSSPPVISSQHLPRTADMQHDRSLHTDVAETPSMIFSSPSLPPPLQQVVIRNAQPAPQKGSNNAPSIGLSTIFKAGQALQGITMPPPGSRERSQSLGSPFKSPSGPRRSDSNLRESASSNSRETPEKSRHRTTSVNDVFAAFSSATRRDMRMNYMTSATFPSVKEKVDAINEDPFKSAEPTYHCLPSSEDKNKYVIAAPTRKTDPLPSALDNQPNDPHDAANDVSSVVRQSKSVSPRELPSPERTKSVTSMLEDEPELDLWQSEAAATPLRDQRKEGVSYERVEVNQKIESAQASKIAIDGSNVVNTGLTSDHAETDVTADARVDFDEDIWMVEAKNSSSLIEEKSSEDAIKHEQIAKPRRSKLSSDWRQNSKRLVYSDELARSSISPKTRETSNEQQQVTIATPVLAPTVDLSTGHEHEEQGENKASQVQPKPRKPELVKSQKQNEVTKPHNPRGLTEVMQKSSQIQSGSEGISELSMLHPIPQKSNFAPRVRSRENGHLNLSVLLGSTPVKPLSTSSEMLNENQDVIISRSQSEILAQPSLPTPPGVPDVNMEEDSFTWDTTDIIEGSMFQPAPQESSHSDLSTDTMKSSANDNSVSLPASADPPVLAAPRQAPPSMSPRKSCLRSSLPNNPSPSKTVVFTGISSSPSHATYTSDSSSLLTSPTPAPTFHPHATASAPAPVTSPAATLSPTTWSKAHWKLLNRIYHDAKRAPPGTPRGACTSALLGKAVRAQGEKLVLTEALLDVVACFRDEVPGWAEDVVVRRLFGLVVDEERRKGLR